MESSDPKGFFGVPISQMQPNYVYVPSSNTSQNLVDHTSTTFILDPQQIPKVSNSIVPLTKRSSAPEMPSNFSPMHQQQQLPPLELSLQPTVTLTETSMIPLQHNFQLVTQNAKVFPDILQNSSYNNEIQTQFSEDGAGSRQNSSVNDEECKSAMKIETTDQTTSLPLDETTRVSQIKAFISDVKEGSVIWKAVKNDVLSQCRLWDILIDKADHDYVAETVSCKLPQDKNRKFKCVVKELEGLLGEFKCFMDGCVEEDKENICQFSLSPELCRAYEISNKSWTLKDESKINSFYRPFFNTLSDLQDEPENANESEENNVMEEEIDDGNEDFTEELDTYDLKPQIVHNSSKDSSPNQTKKRKTPKKEHSQSQDKNLQYKCDICDFSTSAQNGLSLHKRRLHKLDKNNEAVTQLDNPDFHNRDPKKYRHQCSRCTRRYKKIHHLERHQIKCDGIPPPTFKPMWEKNEMGRFVCSVPGCSSEKSWTSSFSVWHHFNSEHANMQDDSYCVWKCDLCDKKFPNKSMLTRHR